MSRERKKTDYIIIHCADTPTGRPVSAADINRWHLQRGFRIGYHFVIGIDGLIERGRKMGQVGAHCKAEGRNWDSIGICLVGRDEFNDKQWASLRSLVDTLRRIYPDVRIRGHRDFEPTKTCPNFDVATVFPHGAG